MFGNIKTVKDIKAQIFLVGGFYGYSKYLKSFSIYKPTQQKFMTSKYQNTTLINNVNDKLCDVRHLKF